MPWHWAAWLAIGYLCGSIPFALLIGLARGVDIRRIGSGNVGATNVARALGRKWGALCFALDVLKGLGPVLGAGAALGFLGREISPREAWAWLAVAAAAVAGHVFPVWLGFRGGKGVATGLGVLLGFWPVLTLAGLASLVTWVALALAFRYVSLASIVGSLALPVYLVAIALLLGRTANLWPFVAVSTALALLVVVRHRANLARLRQGTEPRMGERREAAAP